MSTLDQCRLNGSGWYRVNNVSDPPTGYTAGDNDFFVQVLSLKDIEGDGYVTWAKMIVYDIRSNAIMRITDVNGTWTAWEHM